MTSRSAGVLVLEGIESLPEDQHAASDLVAAAMDGAFLAGAHRVEATVATADLERRRMLQRAGLRPEGVARGAGTDSSGTPVDLTLLARLADDPAPGTSQAFFAMLNASLPTKRLIVQGLLRDGQGRVLLCELTYKQEWDLPGGVADRGESPAATLAREVREELGVPLPVGTLIAVDWLPPYRQWDDALLLVFDLGIHPGIAEHAVLQSSELKAVHWVWPEEVADVVAPYVARLLTALAGTTRAPGTDPVFLEDGIPRPLT